MRSGPRPPANCKGDTRARRAYIRFESEDAAIAVAEGFDKVIEPLLAKAGAMAPSVRAVLRTLLARAKAGVREIPTSTELSARGGGTESTCSRALRQLIALGVIEVRDAR